MSMPRAFANSSFPGFAAAAQRLTDSSSLVDSPSPSGSSSLSTIASSTASPPSIRVTRRRSSRSPSWGPSVAKLPEHQPSTTWWPCLACQQFVKSSMMDGTNSSARARIRVKTLESLIDFR